MTEPYVTIRSSPTFSLEEKENEEYLLYIKKLTEYKKEIETYLNILDYDANPKEMHVLFDLVNPPKEDEQLVKTLIALRLSDESI